jgi:hypothetical protein
MNFSLTKDRSTFTLVKGPQGIATIKYTAQSNSVRLHSNERRLFFVEEVGLLQSKIILETEYGVQIGENYLIKHQNKGVLHLANKKFSYRIDDNGINIMDKRKNPIASFALDKATALDNLEIAALVFSLAWLIINEGISVITAHKASVLYAS